MSPNIGKLCGVVASGALASMTFAAANAADLGGNCCADLEERVAELEATTARKGNRKVSLTVSGHVNQAILFWDDGDEQNIYIGTPNNSRSRFRFKGNAKINADWSAGFYIEIGIRRNGLVALDQDDPRNDRGLDIRHEALFVKSKSMGTIWLGHTGSATEGISEINLGGTLENTPDFLINYGTFKLRDNATGALTAISLFNAAGVQGEMNLGEGNRRNMIKYVTPSLAGFSASASVGGDDFWDVALRYANEFNGIRIAGGIGYQSSTDEDDAGQFSNCTGNDGVTIGGPGIDCIGVSMSASILHVATGLYVTGQYGYVEDQNKGANDRDESWYVVAGIKQKFSPLGATNIFAKYGEADSSIQRNGEVEAWGIGIDQKIDAAAMEVFLTYHHVVADDFTNNASLEFDTIIIGSRIKF